MKQRPKVSYSTGPTILNFTVSQLPWQPGERTLGGHGISGAGIPESYVQRRDYLLRTTLRFYETELAAVMTWLAWAQDNGGTAFNFYPDRDSATVYSVYLEEPVAGGAEVFPTRAAGFARVLELPVTFRSANSTRFITPYIA